MLFSPLHHSKRYSCCPRFSLVVADPKNGLMVDPTASFLQPCKDMRVFIYSSLGTKA